MLIVAGPKLTAKDAKEFFAFAKDNAGKVQFGNPGHGTYAHMTQLALQDMLGTKFNLIPYKGAPQMISDMLAGQIDAVIDLTGGYLTQIKSGKLRALAIIGNKRLEQLPDVPTLREIGLDFTAEPWYGMEGPKGIPAEIVSEMNTAVVAILRDPPPARSWPAPASPRAAAPRKPSRSSSTPKSRSGARSSRSTTSPRSEGRRRGFASPPRGERRSEPSFLTAWSGGCEGSNSLKPNPSRSTHHRPVIPGPRSGARDRITADGAEGCATVRRSSIRPAVSRSSGLARRGGYVMSDFMNGCCSSPARGAGRETARWQQAGRGGGRASHPSLPRLRRFRISRAPR